MGLDKFEKRAMLETECFKIQNSCLRGVVLDFIENIVPDYFFEIGASSSGKYHPEFAQGECGLVRHTQAVVLFVEALCRMNPYAQMDEYDKDLAIAAAIVHDTFKYGYDGPNYDLEKTFFNNHAQIAAIMFMAECGKNKFKPNQRLFNAIAQHMGQWGHDIGEPTEDLAKLVHLADYLASRNFIDIPELTI